jgi:hypothetical protein
LKEQVNECLQKWKRLHARACLDDLRKVLAEMNRFDILNELDHQFQTIYKVEKKKKSSPAEQKVIEAEALHQKLIKFFKAKNIENKQHTFKFLSPQKMNK